MLDAEDLLARLSAGGRASRLTWVERLPARPGEHAAWPGWLDPRVAAAFGAAGMGAPWRHQVEAADLARAGEHVVLSTGTASGKSAAFLAPVLTALVEGADELRRTARGRGATALYLAPTKALAADQLRALDRLLRAADRAGQADGSGMPVRAATFDGDTPWEERDWVRDHASYVLTNPDMLHRSLLPSHPRWARLLRGLRFVVVDECHHYRGVFGSHVAAVLRRLRRVARHYGSDPVFVLASATVSEPERSGARLLGAPVVAVTTDASPRAGAVVGLWEPPLTEGGGERGAPARRTADAETAQLLADLVVEGAGALAFVRSRRGAETVALAAQRALVDVDEDLPRRVAAYRGGYLPEERRAVEQALHSGALRAVATTNALEMGVDIHGLDAVVLAGYPGRRAAVWQQLGRAGRGDRTALGVLVARADPLDTYLVHHPEVLFGQPVEATVLDPGNPYVLGPHLCAAAAELPLTDDDLALFGPTTAALLDRLVADGRVRRRPTGWFWVRRDRASDLADLRGTGGAPYRVVEAATGSMLGTVDAASAFTTLHPGAVYLHQGASYVVEHLDVECGDALVSAADPDWSTTARVATDISVLETRQRRSWGSGSLSFGVVEVERRVVGFLRRRVLTGEVLGEEPLDLPPQRLRTTSVWWTVGDAALAGHGLEPARLPGAAHAAEHAAIGLLPLFATCDRWDVGGVSTARHPDTGVPTVFVHDGTPGGAGFAERGYDAAGAWLAATRDAVRSCGCPAGCPSCVHSPKCGNGNEPLDKAGAVVLLDAVLAGLAAAVPDDPSSSRASEVA